MTYMVEIKDGKWNLYSPKIDMYVIEDADIKAVLIELATEMEYDVKLKIVELLMTFPHGFLTMDGQTIVHEEAVKAYKEWQQQTYQRIVFPDEYHALIDKKIRELLL